MARAGGSFVSLCPSPFNSCFPLADLATFPTYAPDPSLPSPRGMCPASSCPTRCRTGPSSVRLPYTPNEPWSHGHVLLQVGPVSSLSLDSGIGQLSSAHLRASQDSASLILLAAKPGSMVELLLNPSCPSQYRLSKVPSSICLLQWLQGVSLTPPSFFLCLCSEFPLCSILHCSRPRAASFINQW